MIILDFSLVWKFYSINILLQRTRVNIKVNNFFSFKYVQIVTEPNGKPSILFKFAIHTTLTILQVLIT